ncbi:MAG: nucleoside diphosphate kinase regulator [Hyphomicrobiales bacterium]|nr:MAG: nucleoside diphosphate kinase regulator [Hyphomicrobiales bacterium]
MNTISINDLRLSPKIVLGRSDHGQLTQLALAGTSQAPDASDYLLQELDRAKVVADPSVPPDVVRMGSLVKFRTGRDERHVTVCYPAEADIAERRISVLTPVGTALIGMRPGQSISFRTRDGRPQILTVLDVWPPESDGNDDDHGPAAA